MKQHKQIKLPNMKNYLYAELKRNGMETRDYAVIAFMWPFVDQQKSRELTKLLRSKEIHRYVSL